MSLLTLALNNNFPTVFSSKEETVREYIMLFNNYTKDCMQHINRLELSHLSSKLKLHGINHTDYLDILMNDIINLLEEPTYGKIYECWKNIETLRENYISFIFNVLKISVSGDVQKYFDDKQQMTLDFVEKVTENVDANNFKDLSCLINLTDVMKYPAMSDKLKKSSLFHVLVVKCLHDTICSLYTDDIKDSLKWILMDCYKFLNLDTFSEIYEIFLDTRLMSDGPFRMVEHKIIVFCTKLFSVKISENLTKKIKNIQESHIYHAEYISKKIVPKNIPYINLKNEIDLKRFNPKIIQRFLWQKNSCTFFTKKNNFILPVCLELFINILTKLCSKWMPDDCFDVAFNEGFIVIDYNITENTKCFLKMPTLFGMVLLLMGDPLIDSRIHISLADLVEKLLLPEKNAKIILRKLIDTNILVKYVDDERFFTYNQNYFCDDKYIYTIEKNDIEEIYNMINIA